MEQPASEKPPVSEVTGGPVEPVSAEQQEEAGQAVGLEKITLDLKLFTTGVDQHKVTKEQVLAVLRDLAPRKLHDAGVDTNSAEAKQIDQVRLEAIVLIRRDGRNKETDDPYANAVPLLYKIAPQVLHVVKGAEKQHHQQPDHAEATDVQFESRMEPEEESMAPLPDAADLMRRAQQLSMSPEDMSPEDQLKALVRKGLRSHEDLNRSGELIQHLTAETDEISAKYFIDDAEINFDKHRQKPNPNWAAYQELRERFRKRKTEGKDPRGFWKNPKQLSSRIPGREAKQAKIDQQHQERIEKYEGQLKLMDQAIAAETTWPGYSPSPSASPSPEQAEQGGARKRARSPSRSLTQESGRIHLVMHPSASPYVPRGTTYDYLGMETAAEWGVEFPRATAKQDDPGSYVDDQATFNAILSEMHKFAPREYALNKARGKLWGLKLWGNEARAQGRKVGKGTPPRQWFQPGAALWSVPPPAGVGQPTQPKEMSGPLVKIFNKFYATHAGMKGVRPLHELVVRRKPGKRLASQQVPEWTKRVSQGKINVLRDMLDEQTGYGNVLYGAEGRERGKKNTSKSQMEQYIRHFGTPEEREQMDEGMNGAEMHSINRRNAAHYGQLLKHLDKKSGGLVKGRALRGLEKLAHHKGTRPAPPPTTNVPEQDIPHITIHDSPVPSLSRQSNDDRVRLHKTAASRTKGRQPGPGGMTDDARAYLVEEYGQKHTVRNSRGLRETLRAEKKKLLTQFQQDQKDPDVTWEQMVKIVGQSQDMEAYHIISIDAYDREVQGTTTREPSPEPPAMPAGPPDPVDEKEQPARAPSPQIGGAAPATITRPQIRPRPKPHGERPARRRRGVKSELVARRMFEAVPQPVGMPRKQRQQSLIAQPSASGLTEHTSYTHLIEGDLAPVGRVHLVALGPDTGDEREQHILTQLDADSNMGAQNLRERSRRGPFRTSTGRSRVMDRTAHVAYRRRGHAMEITVRRGITDSEMETLIGKLSAHRIASQRADLYLISGSRKKMGDLDRIDMEKLRTKIYAELQKRPTIGLLVQDVHTKGLLHKGYSHSMTFKENNRKMLQGLLAK